MSSDNDIKEKINSILFKMQIGENCIGQAANNILDLFTKYNTEPEPKDLLIVRVPIDVENSVLDSYKQNLQSALKGIYTVIVISERFNERKETTFEIVKY